MSGNLEDRNYVSRQMEHLKYELQKKGIQPEQANLPVSLVVNPLVRDTAIYDETVHLPEYRAPQRILIENEATDDGRIYLPEYRAPQRILLENEATDDGRVHHPVYRAPQRILLENEATDGRRVKRLSYAGAVPSLVKKEAIYGGTDDYGTQSNIEELHISWDNQPRKIRLRKLEKIGQGACGSVYLYKNCDTGHEIARKQVDITFMNKNVEKQVNDLQQEILVLAKIKHKHIVRYYGMHQDKYSISIFMEYAEGGTIRDLILNKGALQEKVVSKYCQQILKGLAYLHESKIVHRDLKCANILLDCYNNCKLTDFGISKHTDDIRSISGGTTFCGTIYWMSPEIIRNEKYGKRTDIWSFGCTVLEMLNTKPPYQNLSYPVAMKKIADEILDPSFPPSTSDNCVLFTKSCLQKSPKSRPRAKELLAFEFISMQNKS